MARSGPGPVPGGAMSENPACRSTHPYLLAGTCPWCNRPVVNGRAAPHVSARDVPERRWNIPASLADMDGPDSEALLTITAAFKWCGPNPVDALPVLRKALSHADT